MFALAGRPARGAAPHALLLMLLFLESELPQNSAAELGLSGAGADSLVVHPLDLHPGCGGSTKPSECARLCLQQPEACPFHAKLQQCNQSAGSDWAMQLCPEAIQSQFQRLHRTLSARTPAGSAATPARFAASADARAWATDPCAIPTNPQADKSILWPASMLRPVWKDPGVRVCSVPKGLDAGTCSRHGTSTVTDVHCIPSFLIIGVQKAATRELSNWLDMHTQLAASGKELHFLNTAACSAWQENPNELALDGQMKMCGRKVGGRRGSGHVKSSKVRARLGPDYGGFWRMYSAYFPSKQEAAREPGITLAPEKRYYFEKTPSYIMMEEESVEKLRSLFPSMRLIVQLRDPVDRMHSWFYMYCGAPGKKSDNFFEVLAGPDFGRVFELNARHVPANSTQYRSVKCTPEVFERLVSVPTSADPVVREVACTDGTCGWSTADIKLSGAPSDSLASLKHHAKSALHPMERGHYAELFRKWWRHFPRNQTVVVHTHLLFTSPIVQMQRIERFLGLDPDDWSSRFHNSSLGTATLVDTTKVSKVETHDRPQPMLARTRALLREYFAPLNKDLYNLLCGASNDQSHQANCKGFADVYPFT